MKRLWISVVMGVLVLIGSGVSAAGDPHLLDKLVRIPYLIAPSISSDGHFISAVIRQEDGTGKVSVWRAVGNFSAAELLPYSKLELKWMAWVGGGRLLMSLEKKGLVLYDAHTRRLRPLIEGGGPRPNELPPVLLSHLPDDPTTILMQWEDPGMPGYPAVYRVNALTGKSQKIISAWKPIIRWYGSPEGEVHLGEGFKGRRQYLYARRADGGWKQISKRDYFDGPAHSVLAVETGGVTALVLSAHASNTRELWRMNIASGDMLKRLAGHRTYDISSALIDPVTDLAVGATYVAEQVTSIVWQAKQQDTLETVVRLIDADQKKGLAKVSLVDGSRIGEDAVTLLSSSRNGKRSLYRSASRNRPSTYYVYDKEAKRLIPLPKDEDIGDFPQVETTGVAITVPKMRQRMHALFSHPTVGPSNKTIVLIHGGPVRRAQDRYSHYISWLVANGYNVLQPNFRGSSGYGERWRKAGYAQWGHDMQVDVRAAAEWLVDQGINRAGDMCIAGGSYGGYAAFLSSINDDDLFACAASLNGVASLPHLVQYLLGNRFNELTVPRIVGRLSARTLRRRSPITRVNKVRMPVLLFHATHDWNVPYEHGVMMAEALAKHGKEYEFVVLKNSAHQLRKTADRRTYLQHSLDFFDRHLGNISH